METSLKKRTRARKACIVCHRKKRKCNGTFPCSNCQKLRYQCEYAPETVKSRELQSQNSQQETEKIDSRVLEPYDSKSTTTKPVIANEDFSFPKNSETNKSFNQEGIKRPVCFADIIGDRLGVSSSKNYKPYAWNLGSRAYPKWSKRTSITKYFSQDQCRFYASIYFEDVNPIFGLLDSTTFFPKLKSVWNTNMEEEFEALICIVVLLGSYFSHTNSLASELEFSLIELSENLLKPETFPMGMNPTITKIVTWMLKSVYLRNIADPADAWLASCTSMHLIETLCIKFDLFENQENSYEGNLFNNDFLSLSNIIMISEAFHRVLAMEIEAAPVKLSRLKSRFLVDGENLQSQSNHLVQLAKVLPEPEETNEESQVTMVETVQKISGFSQEQPNVIALLKAAVSFHMYRKLILTSFHLDGTTSGTILKITDEALDRCLILCDKGLGWWNVLDVPFHGICVLLSMDTKESLLLIPKAYGVLKTVVKTFNTIPSQSALQVSSELCYALRNKKLGEANILDMEEDEGSTRSYDINPGTSDLLVGNPFFDLLDLEDMNYFV
ncbi:c6 zinc finger domain protein [Schizosaccharomyces osmophilus]|uniref:C6 zinc finger domain protein n=1 Tax=Schizosaccharomyces osmophilus TaxID=2545709 RepID=A0AAF0AWB0_9SCHI|nr:c6 zinc finger domain protein [Schizosaccharomyces osmophilus]WBW73397.1 c6 zinc finger domain protein [Schizosaccharomyces osmophilus]